MKVFLTRPFIRFAKDEGIGDEQLVQAIHCCERGLIDAELGGNLIKQRIRRPGQGKSGGFRALIAYKARYRAVFLYGFAKKARDNIKPDELQNLKLLAGDLLASTALMMTRMVKDQRLKEVRYDEEKN